MKQKNSIISESIKKDMKVIITITIILSILILGILLSNVVIKKYIYPIKHIDLIKENCDKYNIDPYLILAVIKAESNFNEKASSRKDAKGLMQLLDSTSEYVNGKYDKISNVDLLDPEDNIRLGIQYIDLLQDSFNNDLNLVVIAYNAGEGNVRNWIKSGIIDPDKKESYANIPYPETKTYYNKIIKNYTVYKQIYGIK